MARFCTKCGRPLEDGEICSCQQQVTGGIQLGKEETKEMKAEAPQPAQAAPQSQAPQLQKPAPQPAQAAPQSQAPQLQKPAPQPVQAAPQPAPQMNQQQVPPQMNRQQVPPQMNQGQIPPQMQGQVPPQMQGQVPPQMQGQIPPQMQGQMPPQMQPQRPSMAAEQCKAFFMEVVELIKSPVTTGQKVIAQANIKFALILIALQALMTTFFALTVCGKCAGLIKTMTGMVDSYSALMGESSSMSSMFKMPYARAFFVTLIVSFAFSCLLALFLMLGQMIIKVKMSYQQLLAAVSIRSAMLIPGILVSILLFLINAGAGLFFFYIIGIWGMVCMIQSIFCGVPQEKRNAFAHVISGAVILFILLAVFFMGKLWTLYLPDMIRTALDQISDPSQLTNLLQGLM